jgi:hypothetical protein
MENKRLVASLSFADYREIRVECHTGGNYTLESESPDLGIGALPLEGHSGFFCRLIAGTSCHRSYVDVHVY